MSTLADDLLSVVDQIARQIDLPLIRSFDLAPVESPPASRKNNFAALCLEDGSLGLTYVALDGALARLKNNPVIDSLPTTSAVEIASLYAGDEGWERALGLAAINAISQHVLARQNVFSPMEDTFTALEPTLDDHIGMVGYFGRLVDPLAKMGIPLTVIELDETLVRTDARVEVTLDTGKLAQCNKVIVTGTTLLNHTLDHILGHCTRASRVLMAGPTASCLPDPLFERGVTITGGFHATPGGNFISSWRSGKRWRDDGFRYALSLPRYPGFQTLLASNS
ncbi:hypothetical protein AB833_07835 [Chromatiales bacterium (ex Bugula neritina AB1)]|nr:hypothetical protein AB833_07835 [Chromatiales bacterium (ex Bugula neritina AB1)]